MLEQWAAIGLQDMATPTTGSRGTTIPDNQATPKSVRQDAQRKAEERTKRRAEEQASDLESFSEEEEYEDPTSTSSSLEEEEGTETPSQPNPVEETELPSFEMHRPTTRSMLGRPTARSKHKVSRKKPEGPNSSARKKCRG